MHFRWWLSSLLICAAGCGGRTEDSDERSGGGGSSSENSSAVSDASAWEANLPLGDCQPGFEPSAAYGRPCNWLGEGLCYDTKEDACNCICPREPGTQCISGFYDGEDSRTLVSCE
jgi:hypothetical protein